MSYTLNIGLARNDGKPDNTLGEVLQAISNVRIIKYVTGVRVATIKTEETVVLRLELAELYNSKLTTLCDVLAQDCIAGRGGATNAGFLHGPQAAKWTPFNLEYFLEF